MHSDQLHWSRKLALGLFGVAGVGIGALVGIPAAGRAIQNTVESVTRWHDEIMALDDHWRYLYASFPLAASFILLIIAWEISTWKSKKTTGEQDGSGI